MNIVTTPRDNPGANPGANPGVGVAIRTARRDAGLTQDALAEIIGCSKAQLSLMEAGRRSVTPARARQIERGLGISDGRISAALDWQTTPPAIRARLQQDNDLAACFRRAFAGDQPLESLRRLVNQTASNIEPPVLIARSRQTPVINKVAAGYPTEFTDLDYPVSVADEYLACPDVTDPDAFAARVVGDSMIPDYCEGEIVVFSPLLPTPSGSDCFVRLERDNETTFKRIYEECDGDRIRLQPLNNTYPPKLVDREDIAGMYAAAYVMRKVGGG